MTRTKTPCVNLERQQLNVWMLWILIEELPHLGLAGLTLDLDLIDLGQGRVDLTQGRVDLTRGRVNLTQGRVDLTQGQEDLDHVLVVDVTDEDLDQDRGAEGIGTAQVCTFGCMEMKFPLLSLLLLLW